MVSAPPDDLVTQLEELRSANDALLTQRKSLQKQKESLAKDI